MEKFKPNDKVTCTENFLVEKQLKVDNDYTIKKSELDFIELVELPSEWFASTRFKLKEKSDEK